MQQINGQKNIAQASIATEPNIQDRKVKHKRQNQ